MLAQTIIQVPAEFSWFLELSKGVGIPGAFLVIMAYSIRKFLLWMLPIMEDVAKAHIERQRSMAISQEKLTDKIIELSSQNTESLRRLEQAMPATCKFLANHKQ